MCKSRKKTQKTLFSPPFLLYNPKEITTFARVSLRKDRGGEESKGMLRIKIRKKLSPWWAYVWANRRLLCRLAGVGVVVGIIITLSMPDEYETTVFTVAEARTISVDAAGSVTARNAMGSERIRDAVLPSHYARVIATPQFLLPLSHMTVRLDDEAGTTLTLYEYLSTRISRPWWSYIIRGIFRLPALLLSPFRGNDDASLLQNHTTADTDSLAASPEGVTRITRRDAAVASALRRRISVEINRDKQSVALSVRMQDPLVSALVADSLQAAIQAYVTDYRTDKELNLLRQNEALLEQSRRRYYQAQEEYAQYMDANRDLAPLAARIDRANLRIRMQQAFTEYTRFTTLVQANRMRVANKRPVLKVVEPARVPMHRASPSLLLNVAVCLLLALGGGIGWLYLKRNHFVIHWRRRRSSRPRRYRFVLIPSHRKMAADA